MRWRHSPFIGSNSARSRAESGTEPPPELRGGRTSGWRLQKAQDTKRCPVLFVVSHPLSDSAPRAEGRAESGPHSPLGDRQARLLGVERANPRQRRDSGAWRRLTKKMPIGIFEQGSRSEPLPCLFRRDICDFFIVSISLFSLFSKKSLLKKICLERKRKNGIFSLSSPQNNIYLREI